MTCGVTETLQPAVQRISLEIGLFLSLFGKELINFIEANRKHSVAMFISSSAVYLDALK